MVLQNTISTVTECTQTLLLHAMIHSVNRWPFAMDFAVYLWNRIPKQESAFAPIELFSGVTLDTGILQRMRVFGCPCYVLATKNSRRKEATEVET